MPVGWHLRYSRLAPAGPVIAFRAHSQRSWQDLIGSVYFLESGRQSRTRIQRTNFHKSFQLRT
jgi:hypothetical protein